MRAVILSLALVIAFSAAADAASRKIEDFYGAFLGHGGEVGGDGPQAAQEKTQRFSQVIIRPASDEHGFTIEWSTLKLKGDELPGQADTKTYVQTFRATDKANVYRDTTSGDINLNQDAAWAVINGDTLSAVQVSVAPDGNYAVIQYDRTLTAGGMDVRFTRIENGRIARAVQLSLLRGPAAVE